MVLVVVDVQNDRTGNLKHAFLKTRVSWSSNPSFRGFYQARHRLQLLPRYSAFVTFPYWNKICFILSSNRFLPIGNKQSSDSDLSVILVERAFPHVFTNSHVGTMQMT